VKGWVSEDFVGSFWEVIVQKILLDYFDICEIFSVFAKFFGGSMIRFDSDNFSTAFRQSNGNYTRTSADINHGVTFFDVGVANQEKC